MSTVPKLTYAKIGHKSKNKIESISSELVRNQQQKQGDLFSQMNQDNLSYIKKQLKLKKHRSDYDKTKDHLSEQKQSEKIQQQIAHRNKIMIKYRGDEQVSQKQPYLEQTSRRSQLDKPLVLNLPEESEQDYIQNHNDQYLYNQERKLITTSYNAKHAKEIHQEREANPMYHSVPFKQEAKKRVISIQGYFGEVGSAYLNKNKEQGPRFVDFLEEYITDLNHSKYLSKRVEDSSIDNKTNDKKTGKSFKQSARQRKQHKQPTDIEQIRKQDLRRLQKLKRNSDTFGQPTINSRSFYNNNQNISEMQSQLKQQRLNTIQLAQQIQKLRKSLKIKQEIIQRLELNNELLYEEVVHLRANQQIIKNKALHTQKLYPSQRQSKMKDENRWYEQANYNNFISHNRQASGNPTNNGKGYSYRDNSHRLKNKQFQKQIPEFFQQFVTSTNKYSYRQKTPRKNSQSAQKLQKQYQKFLLESEKDKVNLRKFIANSGI